jgi:organic hydroperoxide reductase OsmC/OhrA
MTSVQRHATTVWDGDLTHGAGRVNGASGALAELPVTYKSRIGRPDGRTSPEELIAAAHSSCFSMALADLLSQEVICPSISRSARRSRSTPSPPQSTNGPLGRTGVDNLTCLKDEDDERDADDP